MVLTSQQSLRQVYDYPFFFSVYTEHYFLKGGNQYLPLSFCIPYAHYVDIIAACLDYVGDFAQKIAFRSIDFQADNLVQVIGVFRQLQPFGMGICSSAPRQASASVILLTPST
jgi:hypothetical protein